jgi:hypothetical protein
MVYEFAGTGGYYLKTFSLCVDDSRTAVDELIEQAGAV